jgi:transposase
MAEPLTLRSERVDAMPLLLAQLDRRGVQPLRDAHFPTHGNWVGLSLGWVAVLWVTPILSEADHRLNHVQPWAKQRLHSLRGATGQRGPPLDVSDDRLAAVLEALRADARGPACEGALPQPLLRVYDLQPERVRLDSTTASGDWSVTEDGLCQFGPRKDHRPDLPQVQVRLAGLEPLGVPVATDVVPGQRAAEPLSIPAITRVRERGGRRGLLSVGDCTMGALETRAWIQAGGDGSRCPVAEVQRPPAIWEGSLEPMAMGPHASTRSTPLTATGTRQHIADGYERLETLTAEVAGHASAWTERRLVGRARPRARAGETTLRARLATAQAAVAARNDRGRGQRRCTERPALQAAVETSLTRYRGHGLLAGQ